MRSIKTIAIAAIGSTIVFLSIYSCKNTASVSDGVYEEAYLNFPEKLSPETPYDVDTALEHKLQHEQKFAETQRLFEILSWQMFVSINWPLDENGKPKPEITDDGKRSWESWKESFDVFKEDGSKPTEWGSTKALKGKLKIN